METQKHLQSSIDIVGNKDLLEYFKLYCYLYFSLNFLMDAKLHLKNKPKLKSIISKVHIELFNSCKLT